MAELQAGGDLFRRLTSVWHRKALDDVTKEEREQTKQSELPYASVSPDPTKHSHCAYIVPVACANTLDARDPPF